MVTKSTLTVEKWWETFNDHVERVAPVLKKAPTLLTDDERSTTGAALHDFSMQAQISNPPPEGSEIHAQLITSLVNLLNACAAMDEGNRGKSDTYYHIARVEWIVLQDMLKKEGITLEML